jgi:hypothetical protein
MKKQLQENNNDHRTEPRQVIKPTWMQTEIIKLGSNISLYLSSGYSCSLCYVKYIEIVF